MNKYSNDFLSAENEMILYQPDSSISLNVKVEDETVWLTQAQMTELFQSSKQNISLHINNIFKEKELDKISVVKESLTTAADGKQYKTKFYSLDVIISVGYRVKISPEYILENIWFRFPDEIMLEDGDFYMELEFLENFYDEYFVIKTKPLTGKTRYRYASQSKWETLPFGAPIYIEYDSVE